METNTRSEAISAEALTSFFEALNKRYRANGGQILSSTVVTEQGTWLSDTSPRGDSANIGPEI